MATSMTSWTSGFNGGSVGTVGAKPMGSVLPMISWPASHTERMPGLSWKVSAIGWRSAIWNWRRRKRDLVHVGVRQGQCLPQWRETAGIYVPGDDLLVGQNPSW